tara:strand:+ start:112 stop:264 length:153 start_codon:yes stop_codon:yes gene_type:complete
LNLKKKFDDDVKDLNKEDKPIKTLRKALKNLRKEINLKLLKSKYGDYAES